MAKRMDTLLGERGAIEAIDDALTTWEDQTAAQRVKDLVRNPLNVEWAEIAEDAGAVADTLEAIAFDAGSAEAEWRLDAATMIRVRAGGPARRGRLDWRRPRGRGWFACGATGTDWYVNGGAITVARWDHPDWRGASDEEAKRIAEEIDARPGYPESLWVHEG